MSAARVFVARLAGCSVFDPAGDGVGRVRDVLVEMPPEDGRMPTPALFPRPLLPEGGRSLARYSDSLDSPTSFRNLADTGYLASKDFVGAEFRAMLEGPDRDRMPDGADG